ncbi:MAG: M48 family metallopeptidase, partial [Planctomycetota bacterium]
MATDFYQRQSDTRRSTFRLVALFGVAVLMIVGAVVAVAFAIVQTRLPPSDRPIVAGDFVIPAIAGLVALMIIVGGSLFKILQLRQGGGTSVAEGLGGRRIYPNTTDGVERRLMNVVEEMAIASGTPVPPVFLLDEEGINAFAAGYSHSDAVLGITRGCAQNLSRDELQGVIAHEFSHILNGDMRMSIKLIGILHGILLIGLTGQLILRSFFFTGHSRSLSRGNKDGGGGQVILIIIAVAIAAIVLGFIGTFFGNLIKAAVSRQREYLADASAVQFTRNPSGIAGALKRIGGAVSGSKLKAANAAEVSHMYFSAGTWQDLVGLWATHPPLEKRIRAIDKNWDGKFLQGPASSSSFTGSGAAGFAGSAPLVEAEQVPVEVVDQAFQQVGQPTTEHQHYAVAVIQQLPQVVLDTVHEPYGARAVVY